MSKKGVIELDPVKLEITTKLSEVGEAMTNLAGDLSVAYEELNAYKGHAKGEFPIASSGQGQQLEILGTNYLLLSVAFAELAQTLEKVDLDLAKNNKIPLDKGEK